MSMKNLSSGKRSASLSPSARGRAGLQGSSSGTVGLISQGSRFSLTETGPGLVCKGGGQGGYLAVRGRESPAECRGHRGHRGPRRHCRCGAPLPTMPGNVPAQPDPIQEREARWSSPSSSGRERTGCCGDNYQWWPEPCQGALRTRGKALAPPLAGLGLWLLNS